MDTNNSRHLIPGTLSFYKFHGKARNIDYPNLCQYDIIFTTYGTVAADYWRKRSLLHEIQWYRIVLDEGLSVCII
jgi:SWI/SNF-related matrix-associated actin-dependent regulator of chromatin subfamily A3